MQNPYLDEYLADHTGMDWSTFGARERLVARYAWAIPNEKAIDAIVELSPIVELGAGNGYWAWLLEQKGAQVKAYDKKPGHHAHGAENPKLWATVLPGTERVVQQFPDHTLFLCWPPYDTSFAANCLKYYSGKTVAYVGESEYGCTGDEAFHAALDDQFKYVKGVSIPRWHGMHDHLGIWQRK